MANEEKEAGVPEAIKRGPGYSLEEIDALFTYKAPQGTQAERYARISKAAAEFAKVVKMNTPDCADQTTAIRAIIAARMEANQVIANNEPREGN